MYYYDEDNTFQYKRSPYNNFMKDTISKLRQQNTDRDHTEIFKEAQDLWRKQKQNL